MQPLAMRRLVLPLAVALGAGCILQANTDTGRVNVYWTFWSQSLDDIGAFTDTATSICTRAAVDDVRLRLTTPSGATPLPWDWPCINLDDIPGAAYDGLEAGTWTWVLEARRGGVTVFRDSGTFEAIDGKRAVVESRALPPSGNWDVTASYTATACAAGDRLDFDLIATGGATRVKAFSTRDAMVNPPVSLPCGSGSFTIPSVAPGTYELSDWVHVDASGTTEVAYGTCRPSWTQPNDTSVSLAVAVTAATPPPEGNPGICP
jgi:hypothetical protein